MAFDQLPAVVTGDPFILNATQLSQLSFQDLYFDSKGMAMIRGLETNLYDKTPILTGVPEGVMPDMITLIEKTYQMGSDQNTDRFFIEHNGQRFRSQRMDTVNGICYTLRLTMQPPRLSAYKGVAPAVAKTLIFMGSGREPAIGSGLIMIVGETASGKTTFGYSLVQEYLIRFGDIAVSVEDPVEVNMTGGYGANSHGWFYQHDMNGRGWNNAMEVAMRETPRIIYIGEIRSKEAAMRALEASLNGHIIISTMHSDNPINALNRLITLSDDKELARQTLASGISAVIHQKLKRNKGMAGKYLEQDCLFFDRSAGPRGMIRNNITHQLSTTIEQQRNLIKQGEIPVFLDS